MASTSTTTNRNLTGYNIYISNLENIDNEDNWQTLTTNHQTTIFTDQNWPDLENDTYTYIVKAAYTGGLLSEPAFSNPLEKINLGSFTFVLIPDDGGNLSGVVITITNNENPEIQYQLLYYMLTGNIGFFRDIIPGEYTLTVVHDNYHFFSNVYNIAYGNGIVGINLNAKTSQLTISAEFTQLNPLIGATITLQNNYNPEIVYHHETSQAFPVFHDTVFYGTYTLNVTHPNYEPFEFRNVVINEEIMDLRVNLQVSETDETQPLEISNLKNYPNPFNPSTTISFQMRKTEAVNLSIYDIKGRKIITLIDNTLNPGHHEIIWNGINSNNESVGNGIYFYRISTPTLTLTKKMLLLK
jgi:hypothetical protein